MPKATKKPNDKPAKTIRVLLVDDHPVVRRGYAQRISIEPDMESCGEAATAHEAFQMAETLGPDVMLIDISLGEGNGLDLIKDLKSRGDRAKMLVVSGLEEEVYAERCVKAGAHGYLNKADAVDCVVDAIRQIARGGYYLSESMTNLALQWALSGEKKTDSPLGKLSDRELQVYELIGQGLTVNEIADKLFLSPKTIETYRAHLKEKLKLKNSAELTRHAIRWALQRV